VTRGDDARQTPERSHATVKASGVVSGLFLAAVVGALGYGYHYYKTVLVPRVEVGEVVEQYTLQASVGGSAITVELPDVVTRYDPDTRQYTQPGGGGVFDGYLHSSDGLDIGIIGRRAKGRYLVAWRRSSAYLELEVDTIGRTVEPANDEARRYFAFQGSSFEAPRQQSTGGGLSGFGF